MTLKQNLFIQQYLKHRNATMAIFEVYDVKNYNTASVMGSRLLRNAKVRSVIDTILEANMAFPTCIALLLKRAIETGSARERMKAIQIGLKLHGVL